MKDIKWEVVVKFMEIFSVIKIDQVMSAPPIIVRPNSKVETARRLMKIRKISGLPVVDENMKLIGIFSIEDLVRFLESDRKKDKVKDWMSTDVVFLNKNMTVDQAAKIVEEKPFGRFPVIDENEMVVGVLTRGDILRWLLRQLCTIYIHDERREETLSIFVSPLTGSKLEREKANFKFHIDYTSLEKIGTASVNLKRFLMENKVEEDLIRRVSISAYEAEANVVLHSGSDGYIYCWIEEDQIRVLVEDFGKGIEDVELAMREGFTTASEEIKAMGFGAGMGLPNMKRFSDKMVVISEVGKGTKVEMIFYGKK